MGKRCKGDFDTDTAALVLVTEVGVVILWQPRPQLCGENTGVLIRPILPRRLGTVPAGSVAGGSQFPTAQ